MIVDTHVHVWEIDPPRYPVGPTAPNFTSLPDEPATADELLAEMDQHGVDWTVLVQTSWSTWDNGYIANSAARFPDRFVGHGLINPRDPANAELVRYWMTDRGLAGFRFHPLYYPNEKILLTLQNRPMWEESAGLDAVVQFHLDTAHANKIEAIAQQYPRLRLILNHMGYPKVSDGLATFQAVVDLARYEKVYVKISDIAGHSSKVLPFEDVHPFIKKLVDTFGAERLIYGTGYPRNHRIKHNWLPLSEELSLIRDGLPFLTDTDRDQMLGGTAADIWGLR